ncbi:3-isopropylmalate dehydratase small subunit [Cupriavidus necator H850]|uniref:3-isopropylmalate dehydratase small subunit n=1 Tax=Cupriavidus necator TaxID=106590 RepID=UPI00129DD228|nr:3-isopropylmalate dehydratase small subunit [Cupriavidus necator]KAI3596430.1 3-isopropylmalate dehydratase small subunit [Cupriavidus necator H850]
MPKPIDHAAGRALLIPRDDVDTDAIYPSRFLNTIARQGLGPCLFADWRVAGLDEFDAFAGRHCIDATVLVAGRNFGCGSSREHAVWALADCGVQAVVALSFGDIFRSNCVCNGIITAVVGSLEYRAIVDSLTISESREVAIDLRQRLVKLPDGGRLPFSIDSGDAQRLLSGDDDISATLAQVQRLQDYEDTIASEMPWLAPWREAI